MPVWDRVGNFTVVHRLMSYAAPAINDLTSGYGAQGAPQLPLKRFLIASTSMIELTFWSCIAALFVRGVRRHALLVWTCYDRMTILLIFRD